jgi:restriction endonuclease Mrr
MGVVVLGQAKCLTTDGSVGGRDLARLVARLQRGWFGVFVTTGVFSTAAQQELYEDRSPVVLINGKRLARELRLILNTEGATLAQLLEREREWAQRISVH